MNERLPHPSTSRGPRAGEKGLHRNAALAPWLRLSQQRHLRDPEAGASLAYALVIALVVIATGAALASRTLFSTFGASVQQDTRRAREAAEVGIRRTIAELNRERNRGLLAVSPAAGGFWSAAEVAANPNRCAQTENDPARPATADLDRIRSGGVEGTFTANPVVYIRDDGTLVAEQEADGQPDASRADDVRYAYQLVSKVSNDGVKSVRVAPSPDDGTEYRGGTDANGRLTQPATLTIRMRGFSYNNGQLTGSTTLEGQIEVVPKCCGRSLANFGSDLRSCTEGLGEGFGILLLSQGSAKDEIGEATLTGLKAQISSNESPTVTIDPIICIGTTDSQCASSVKVGSTYVAVLALPLPENFPKADIFPASFGNVAQGTLQTCNVSPSDCASNHFHSDDGSKTVINADTVSLDSLPDYCRYITDSGVTTIHCLLAEMNIGQDLEIRTSSTRRLKFYFPSEVNFSEDNNSDDFQVHGAGTLTHVNTNPPSTTDQRLNDAASVQQLQFFGCRKSTTNEGCEGDPRDTNSQRFTFNVNSGSSGDPVFFYFPIGKMKVNGGGGAAEQFNGVLWTNSLTGTGNVEIRVPGSGVNSLFASYGVIDGTAAGNDEPILWDFVARAVRSFRLIQGS